MIHWDLLIDGWNFPSSSYTRKMDVIIPSTPEEEEIPSRYSITTGYGAAGYSAEIYQALYGSDWQYRLWYITAYGETPEGREDFEGDRQRDPLERDSMEWYNEGPEATGDPEYPFQDFNYGL